MLLCRCYDVLVVVALVFITLSLMLFVCVYVACRYAVVCVFFMLLVCCYVVVMLLCYSVSLCVPMLF